MKIYYKMNVKNITNLRLITFDVTNTLLNTSVKKHYAEISLKHDVSLNPDKLEPSFKKYFKHWCHEHPNFGKDTGIGWESWWKNIIWNVFKDQNLKISDEKIDKVIIVSREIIINLFNNIFFLILDINRFNKIL